MIFVKNGRFQNVLVKQIMDPGVIADDPRTAIPATEPKTPLPIIDENPEPVKEDIPEADPFDDLPPDPGEPTEEPEDLQPAAKAAEPSPPSNDEEREDLAIGKRVEVRWQGQIVKGTVTWIADDDSAVTVQTDDGRGLTLDNPVEQIESIIV